MVHKNWGEEKPKGVYRGRGFNQKASKGPTAIVSVRASTGELGRQSARKERKKRGGRES